MTELQVTATLTIHAGKLDEFRAAAQECIQSVRDKDTDTLQYDWFFNEDQSVCVVRERYKDSDAILQHIQNLGDTFGTLLGASDISLEVFGNPSKELQDATAGLPTKVYSYFGGM